MTAISGKTQLDNLIPEVWSSLFYDELRANLPMANFFERAYEGQLVKGDTVKVDQIEAPDGEILTDDLDNFNSELMTVNQIDIIVNKRASAAFEFTDLAKLQSIDFENQAKEALVYAISKKIEGDITTALIPSASAPDHIIAPASASDLAAADVAAMRTLLSVQNVPNNNRGLFLSPTYYGDIIQKTAIASSEFIPVGSPSATGSLATPIYGFQTIEAGNLGTDIGYAAHRNALQMIMQQGLRIKVSDLHSNNKYGYILSADIVYGIKLMDNKRIVKISG